jgi:hypothetical protein
MRNPLILVTLVLLAAACGPQSTEPTNIPDQPNVDQGPFVLPPDDHGSCQPLLRSDASGFGAKQLPLCGGGKGK